MKTILLLSLFTLSLIAADPGITIESTTRFDWSTHADIGVDNATGARFLVWYSGGNVSTLALPPIPPRLVPPKPVVKAKPKTYIEFEKVTELDPEKMDIERTETHVFEQDRAAQLKQLQAGGWRVIGEFNVAGFNKYKLERLVPKAIEKPVK